MRDSEKPKDQLIEELEELRARVSESKQQVAVQAKLRQLELIVTHVGEGIASTDHDGTIISWNRSAERIFGYSAEEIIGKSSTMLLPPNRLDEPQEVIEKLKQGEQVVRLETERVAKNGRLVPVKMSIVLVKDDRGQFSGITAIFLDITERQRAEKALRTSEARFRSAFEQSPFGMALLNTEGQFLHVNTQLCAMFGYTAEEFQGLRSLDITHPDDLTKSARALREIQEVGGSVILQKRYLRKDGEMVHALVAGAPYYDETIAEQLYLSQFVDITEKMRLEAQLVQAERMSAIGTLAGGVAHDMNNVLAVVLGLGSVLETQIGPDDPKSHDIQGILSAARRGKSLVGNLLGFARKGQYQRQIVYLNDTATNLVDVLAHTLSKKVTLNTALDDQLMAIECDAGQIMQALMNLCMNANDALGGRGTITIATRNEVLRPGDVGELEGGRYVEIQVKDNGVGMDEETQKRAFEPFFTTKDIGKGTGLGLSMVYGVIENHGGTVTIDSAVGEGTTVTILLPAADPEAVTETVATRRSSARPGKGRILVIDDEAMIRTMAKRLLQVAGYEVLVSNSGHAALDILRDQREQIDLVILDLSMPEMDGAECFEELRKIDASLRVLVCTGHGNPANTEGMIANGAVGVVTKPFDLEELSDAVAAAFGEGGETESAH